MDNCNAKKDGNNLVTYRCFGFCKECKKAQQFDDHGKCEVCGWQKSVW